MAAYNWIVFLLALGFFGLLYACTYDVVLNFYDNAYVGTEDAALTVKILFLCWKFAPICCLCAGTLYVYLHSQKG